jgi:hypothetical protein
MENGPFIDDFPIETSIYKGFSMAMLNNQMVTKSIQINPNHHVCCFHTKLCSINSQRLLVTAPSGPIITQ